MASKNKSKISAKSKQSKKKKEEKTYPADCRKIAAVDSNKHDWD